MDEFAARSITCFGCGAIVADIDGPTHKYLGATPGCWKLFGDILAREYGDFAYMKVHRLTVDAYALQHLGKKSPQTIQSMNLHLLALCAAFEHGIAYDFIPKIMNRRLKKYKDKKIFTWLTPPQSLGKITVVDVVAATSAQQHSKLVRKWARSVWRVWGAHHQQIEDYYSALDANELLN